MEFENKAHRKAAEKIEKMVRDLFPEDQITPHENIPGWMIRQGSAVIHVTVVPWRDGMHLVKITSYVVRGPELLPTCLRFLLDENQTKAFGGFAVDSDGDIVFRQSLLAEFCEKDELKIVIGAVSFTADQMDDVITQRWGGRRATDR